MDQILPVILKLYKGKRRSTFILEIHKDNFSVFIEEILHVSAPDVRGEISNVNSAV